MSLGACGVSCGSVYLNCPESHTNKVHRDALQFREDHLKSLRSEIDQSASPSFSSPSSLLTSPSPPLAQTAVTTLFTGRPARGIVNRFMIDVASASAAKTTDCLPMPAYHDHQQYLHFLNKKGEICSPPPFPHATEALEPLKKECLRQGRADFVPLWSGEGGVGMERAAGVVTRSLFEF